MPRAKQVKETYSIEKGEEDGQGIGTLIGQSESVITNENQTRVLTTTN